MKRNSIKTSLHTFIFIIMVTSCRITTGQYCIPQHSWPILEAIIDGVELEDIVNTGTGEPDEDIGYTDYTYLSTDLAAGSAYTIYMDNSSYQYNYAAWIDYNQNQEFEEDEMLGFVVLTGIQSGSFDFAVPADALNGDTRLRVRAMHEPFGPWLNSIDPCLPHLLGDTEDYTVHILGGVEENARLSRIISPVSAVGLSEEAISIEITNNGETDLEGVIVNYIVDGGPVVTETVPGVIPAGEDHTYTFLSLANFSETGCHSLSVYIDHPGDDFNADDTINTEICNLNYVTGNKKWLIHSNIDGGAEVLYFDPYFNTTNTTCMNTVFGEGNWSQEFFETVDPTVLFSDSSCFIFMDGSFNHVVPLAAFIEENQQLMENWVAAGGKLFLNSNGSEMDGENFYVDFGFDGTKLTMSYQVADIKKKAGSTHPIYNGPYLPVGTTWSEFYASNAVLYGKNYDTLAHENLDGMLFGAPNNDMPVLMEKNWGLGKAMLSAWGPSQILDPGDKGMNLRQNIIYYLSDCVFEIPDDAGVSELLGPLSSCELTDAEEIQITLHNYGAAPLSDIPVAYRINGGTEILETAVVEIAAGSEAVYTFSTTADLSEPGSYLIETYTLLAGDGNLLNDTTANMIVSSPTPVVDLGDDLEVCEEAILDAGNPGFEYIWSTGETTQQITVTGTGTYSVTISDPVSGCTAADIISVVVEYAPVASFNVTTVGNTVICENTSTGEGSFFWEFGDGGTSTETNPTYTYAVAGDYTITLTITNDCGASTFTFDITIQDVGIQTYNSSMIHVFPNPASSLLIVEVDNLCGRVVLIEMYDLTGKRVKQINGDEIQSNSIYRIDVTDLRNGYYVVNMISSKGRYENRIEIIR